jgi:ABC-type antimicrobial peptide transport system permease subunit
LILTTAAVSERYSTIVDQSFGIYSTNIVVISKGSLLLGGLPVGAEIPQTESYQIQATRGVSSVIPILVIFSVHQLVPANVTIGIPLGNFSSIGNLNKLDLSGAYPSTNDQMIVGGYLAKVSNLRIGSVVAIGNSNLSVSGIVHTTNIILGNAAIMPLQTAQSAEGYDGLVSAFLVTSAPASPSTSVIKNINSNANGLVAISSQSSESLTSPLANSLGAFDVGISIFAAFVAFLFVAVITIVNLSEQKEELSTIRAIGSSFRSVLKVTLSEIAFVVLVGAVLGFGFATIATALFFRDYGGVPISTSILSTLNVIPTSILLESELGIIAFGILVAGITTMALLRKLN